MEMHLRLTAGGVAQVRQRAHHVGIVLLDRVEKSVLWRLPVRVLKLTRERGEIPPPGRHPRERLAFPHTMKRLEVIAHRDHHMAHAEDVLVEGMTPPPRGQPKVEGLEQGTRLS